MLRRARPRRAVASRRTRRRTAPRTAPRRRSAGAQRRDTGRTGCRRGRRAAPPPRPPRRAHAQQGRHRVDARRRTALVLMMSVPALALFYGGMVRSKNMLSVLMQVFVVFSLITVLWCVYGYSLAFTEGNAFFGGFDRLFLKGTFDSGEGRVRDGAPRSRKGVVIPELVFVAFQATFAAITVLPDPRRVRRAREVLGGAALRGAVVHVRVRADRAHGVVLAGPGCVHGCERRRRDEREGRLDLADGARSTSRAARSCTSTRASRAWSAPIVIGKRIGYGKEAMAPHNLPMTMIGASLLWVGWFGFNAGSALEAEQLRGARVHQHVPRDRLRGAVVDVRRVDAQGQAVDARCGVRRGRGPRRDHAGGRQRRHPRRVRDRHRSPASSACGA